MAARRPDPSRRRSSVTRRSAKLVKSAVGHAFLALSFSPPFPALRSQSATTPTTGEEEDDNEPNNIQFFILLSAPSLPAPTASVTAVGNDREARSFSECQNGVAIVVVEILLSEDSGSECRNGVADMAMEILY
ncbi:hypothetical protein TIFTF001_029842 [Ficus carica]|uniref:Uncharacterized protein n=1 Tax=Ficus carica TaxID=3494 RepID=A0AA88DSC4_FICCA|nr:hypothetical protein TIFTF001_029842 [Ficus carica]